MLLSPWAVATVGISVTFPLLFVHGRGWWLPILAVAVIGLQIPLARLGQVTLGLEGIALSLAITTGLILVVMLAALGSARRVLTGLAMASAIVGAIALVAFLPPWALLDPVRRCRRRRSALRHDPCGSPSPSIARGLALSAGSDMIIIGRVHRPRPLPQ